MLSILFCIFFLSSIGSVCNKNPAIIELNDENFKTTTENNPYVLVEFYAPWCKYCKNFAPEYDKTANLLQKSSLNVKLAKIDAAKHTSIAKEHGIKGYPTLKLFKNGQCEKYEGDRDAWKIAEWIKTSIGQ